MIRNLSLISAVLTFALILSLPAQAETQPQELKTRELEPLPNIVPNEKPESIDRAERLMRLGEYDRAAAYLELQLEKTPRSISLRNLLTTCYEKAKDYDKLLLFLRHRLESEPPRFPLYRDLGRAYVLLGQTDSARIFLFHAARMAKNREGSLATIAGIYHKFGLYELESELIDSLRIMTGNFRLLSSNMGDALAAQKRYGAATLEYLTYMEKDTIAAKEGEGKLIEMIRFPESADTVMSMLSDRIKQQPEGSRLLNIYGQLLIEQEKYDEAFEFFKGLDSAQSGNGADIMYFMRECNRRQKFEQTISAANYILEYLPQTSLLSSILFLMSQALTSRGEYDKALDIYRTIAADNLRPAQSAEAHLRIGQVLNDYLDDQKQAGVYFLKVIRAVPGSRFDVEARFGLADISIKEKNYDSAVGLFENIIEREIPEDMAERAEFILAEIFLFKEDYEESVVRFRRLINTYPKGLFVNDAIQYSLIISETLEDSPKQMDLFAAAEYYRYIRKTDSLEYYLSKICKIGIPSLAPISYLYLARLFRLQERFDEAVAMADSLSSQYSESYYLPYGLKVKADILLLSPRTREFALDIYRSLLSDYATYPFAAEVRNIIRRETSSGRI